MPNFTEQDAENCVAEALSAVANYDRSKLRTYNFGMFHDYHKKVFLNELKNSVNKITDDIGYRDITLNESKITEWDNMGDCIKYVYHNAGYHLGTAQKLNLLT